jgi:hypothetical protein
LYVVYTHFNFPSAFFKKKKITYYKVKSPAMEGFLGGGEEMKDTGVEDGSSSAAPSEKAILDIIFRSVSFVSILIPAGDMFGLDFVLDKGDSLIWKYNLDQTTSVEFMVCT